MSYEISNLCPLIWIQGLTKHHPESHRNILTLRSFAWMKTPHVLLQALSERELSPAHGAYVPLDSGVRGKVIVIVRTTTVAFPTCLTSVADEFLVHKFHMFVQPILADARTLALWAGVPSSLVRSSNVL